MFLKLIQGKQINVNLTGSFTGSFSGSFNGTGSYATQALSASYALSSSYALTSSYSTNISGSTNYLPKFSGSNSLANSLVYDNGTNVGIGTTSPGAKLDILGSLSNGFSNAASGIYSHAEGRITSASGNYSHAEGTNTISSGLSSHAEGSSTVSSGQASHAEGQGTTSSGYYSHAEGSQTAASGFHSHAEGESTLSSGASSHAEGYLAVSSGDFSHAEGTSTKALGQASHAEGRYTSASGNYSHAEGQLTNAVGERSHAEGELTISSGQASHAEGFGSTSSGGWSHAEGTTTVASGNFSHAEGSLSVASSFIAHAEGYITLASGVASHAEGESTVASGVASHAEGLSTVASGPYQHVQGQFNISSSVQSALIVGNGTSDANRSNLIFAAGSQVQVTGSLGVTGGITGSILGTSSYAINAATASNILGGSATHIPFFKTDTTLATSSLYQSGSGTVIINQDNATSANPEALYVWQPHPTSINVISGKGNLNNYLQLNIHNTNQGTNASSDVVATANNGDETTNYIDMGINSENFNGDIGGVNDAYLYSTGRHLHIGTATDYPVQIFAGGLNSDANRKLELRPDNNHSITGSLEISGSLKVNQGITGSLLGTSSYALQALSASWAPYQVSSSYALSSSYAETASYAPLYLPLTGGTINGNVTVTGTASIAFLNVLYESASVIYSSGSNVFGDATNDTQTLNGTVLVSGSQQITGSLSVTGGITGSLFGTSSWAVSSSYALTASFLNGDTNAFIQGGNSFGTTALVGTNDNQAFALETSGSERMRITSTGNVGIGTTVPGSLLHVNGTFIAGASTTSGLFFNTANDTLVISNQRAIERSGSGLYYGNANTLLQLRTNSTARLHIDNTGNVGIGTTTPAYKLDVSGSIRVISGSQIRVDNATDGNYTRIQERGLYFSRNNGANEAVSITSPSDNQMVLSARSGLQFYGGGVGTQIMYLNDENSVTQGSVLISGANTAANSGSLHVKNSANTQLFKVFNGGSVAIGNVTAPGNTLHISASGAVARIESSTTYAGVLNKTPQGNFYSILDSNTSPAFGAADAAVLWSDTSGPMIFATVNTERMRIDSSGNIGIGTTAPGSYKLNVNGSLRVQNSSFTNGMTLSQTANSTSVISGGPSTENITFGPSNSINFNAAQLNLNGNIGISANNISANSATGTLINNTALIQSNTVRNGLIFQTQAWQNNGAGGSSTINAVSISPNVNMTLGTTTGVVLLLNPILNTTGGTNTLKGIYYNPTLTSLTGTTHTAIETVTGDVIFGSTSGNVGIGKTTPNAKLDVNGNTIITGSLQVSQSIFQYSNNAAILSGSTANIASFNTSSYMAGFFDFVASSNGNARAGTVFTVWNGTSLEYVETSTNDIGSTTNLILSASISGANVLLQGTSLSGSWNVKTLTRMI